MSAASWACPRPSTTTSSAPTTAPATPPPPSISPPPSWRSIRDAHVYDTGMITIIEMHGPPRRLAHRRRRAGRRECGDGSRPRSTCPRSDFDMDNFIEDVKRIYDEEQATASSPSPRASTMRTAASSPRRRSPRTRRLRPRPAGRSRPPSWRSVHQGGAPAPRFAASS